jgi:hypothetical protein
MPSDEETESQMIDPVEQKREQWRKYARGRQAMRRAGKEKAV